MEPRTVLRKLGALALALLIVSAGMQASLGSGPVGTAQAGFFDDCSFSDSFTLAVGASLGLSNQDCSFWSPDDSTSGITDTDAKATMLSVQDSQSSYTTTYQNMQQDTRSVAWIKAKVAVLDALNNGKNESQARAAAKEAVEDYYARQHYNVLEDWSAKMQPVDYVLNSTGNVSAEYRYDASTPIEVREFKHRLVNGSTVNVTGLWWDDDGGSEESSLFPHNISGGSSPPGYLADDENANYLPEEGNITYIGPNTDGAMVVLDEGRYSAITSEIYAQNSQVQANVDAYVTDVYAAYSAGDINSTDLANSMPDAVAAEASTDLNSTGYYGFANTQLSALGVGSDLNASHVVSTSTTVQSLNSSGYVTQTVEDREITGTLFYTGSDVTSFNTGQTYDPANLNGSVYMTISSQRDSTGNLTGSQSGYFYVNRSFTIDSATNVKTGESLNSTQIEEKNYTTTNASALEQEIEELKELRAYYEEQQTAAAGGGSGFSNTEMLLGLIALAGVAYFYGNREGRR